MIGKTLIPGLSTFLFACLALAGPASAGEYRAGGKLLLTNGISSVEGSSGGGLTPWATIAGDETENGIGFSAHATIVKLKSYDYRSAGASIGLFDRVELSYAHQNFDTNEIGALLGLGRNYTFNQDVFGVKARLLGDVVYEDNLLPAIAVGAQYKHVLNAAVVRAIGARTDKDVDLYISATKLFLSRSLLLNVTARWTRANQFGLLGFGGDKSAGHSLQPEVSLAYQLSRRFALGGEYRARPDKLHIAREDDGYDLFAAYAVNRHLTATIAYVDLGSIATVAKQRGVFLSLQAAY